MSLLRRESEGPERNEHVLQKIAECRTQYDIFRFLKNCTRDFGYEYFNLLDIASTNGRTLEQTMRLTSWPRELIHEYDAGGLLTGNPVIEWCKNNAKPFVYDMETDENVDRSERGRRVHELFAQFGMTCGIYQPVHCPAFGSMAVGMQGARTEPCEDELREISWIAQLVCARTEEIGYITGPPQIALTDRELECLKWTAAGKTSSEIGTIVGISTHTVDHHLNSASQKLNASNRAHAVATALRVRIIN